MSELQQAIIKMVEQGGTLAVWIYAVYLGVGLLKFLVGMSVVVYGIKSLFRMLKGLCKPHWCAHDGCLNRMGMDEFQSNRKEREKYQAPIDPKK